MRIRRLLANFTGEFNSLLLKEWLAFNPKVYSINHQTLEDLEGVLKANEQKEIIEPIDPKNIIEKNLKVCQGIKAVVLKNEIEHQDFQNVLETNEPAKRDIISIRSFNHQLYTQYRRQDRP